MEGNESVDVDPPVAPQPVPVPLPAGTARVLGGEEITAALPIDVDEDAESSDGNWSSGSSFNEDSDDESILTYDTADDESINFVSPKAGRSEWTTSCYSDDKGPFSRPDGEGSWKMDPEASYSDYTLIVVSKEKQGSSAFTMFINLPLPMASAVVNILLLSSELLAEKLWRDPVGLPSLLRLPTSFLTSLTLSIILATWETSLCSFGDLRGLFTAAIYFLCEVWLCTLVAVVC